MTFDVDNPPQDYKLFKREILKTVEDAEIEADEEFDLALFTVNRENEANLLYIEDLVDRFEEDTSLEDIVEIYLPQVVKKFNSKFFAFVFPGFEIVNEDPEDDPELLCVLTGSLFDMHLMTSEVYRSEDVYAELGPWENQDPSEYPQLTVPFRKSITYQSE